MGRRETASIIQHGSVMPEVQVLPWVGERPAPDGDPDVSGGGTLVYLTDRYVSARLSMHVPASLSDKNGEARGQCILDRRFYARFLHGDGMCLPMALPISRR